MPLPASRTKLAAQADAFARLLRACLAVPRCVSFTIWGAGDAYSWVPDDPDFPGEGAATPFDADLRPKPAYGSLARALGARTL